MDLIKKESVSKEDDSIEKCCLECKSTKTPLWRIGPAGPRTLCNACGIRYAKTMKKTNKNKIPKPKALSPTNPSTTTKSVPSVSSSTKLGNMQRCLQWGLNYSPLRPQNGRYRSRNSPSSTTMTTSTTTTVVKNGDTADIRKSLKIGLRTFGEEVVLLQRQRSSTVRRKRRINEEEEEAAALLIALSNCGSVLV